MDLQLAARGMMELHWRETHAVPNDKTYPHCWLWDSCFHSIIWSALDDQRAVTELETVLGGRDSSGMVPHMQYLNRPDEARLLWGRYGASTITQPPMFGHALAVLDRKGYEVGHLVESATEAILALVRARSRACGLAAIIHPWESGCDDSPRWNPWAFSPFDREQWRAIKWRLVGRATPAGQVGLSSPEFEVCAASFNAIVAFNLIELAEVSGNAELRVQADGLAANLDRSWDTDARTWADLNPDGTVSSSIRTLEALLGTLVSPDRAKIVDAFAQLEDPAAFGAPYGPRGLHLDEPDYRPDTYWRGAAWPQLDYLLWVAARRAGDSDLAGRLATKAIESAEVSHLAEYRNPETGEGLGAAPQSWTALALAMM